MSGKGICIQGFGTWSFGVHIRDLGCLGPKTLKTPVFTLAEKFSGGRIRVRRGQGPASGASGSVPVVPISALSVASLANVQRDDASAALKDIFIYALELANEGRPLSLMFPGVGTFVSRGAIAEFKWDAEFAGNEVEDSGNNVS